ncbi:MAG TPA: hypothetical protein VM864_01515 [Pyrinomonadaceae bacterium]|jgi:hypothetical protein|nr:hypothetical protein [Pyrinomonadaceae bacterium]
MAINAKLLHRPSDRGLFRAAAILFPLVVLAGYFKSYYFSAFFDVRPVANALVHAHGLVMTLWVVYFTAQISLIRTKNVRLHMTMGMAGVALAAVVVVVGLATAYDAQLVRGAAPAGIPPHSFFLIPVLDMILFVVFFAGAIYYRKRPAEHKTLMLMTAINFMPAALSRTPMVPAQFMLHWAFGVPALVALVCLGWHTAKHCRLNKVFAAAVLLLIAAHPLRLALAGSKIWLQFAAWLAP